MTRRRRRRATDSGKPWRLSYERAGRATGCRLNVHSQHTSRSGAPTWGRVLADLVDLGHVEVRAQSGSYVRDPARPAGSHGTDAPGRSGAIGA